MFVCFEGIDGAGKSTQAKLLKEYLEESDFNVELVFDPGTTKLGMAIRQLILDCDDPISPDAQMLLFSSARSELSQHIKKQRQQGKIIVCDRWLLSTLVYQSRLNGVDAKLVVDIFSQTSVSPDLCIVLDLPPEQAELRKQHEIRKDRYERVTLAQKQMMRNAYLEFCQEPAVGRHIHVLNANRPHHEVSAEIVDLFFSVKGLIAEQTRGIACQL